MLSRLNAKHDVSRRKDGGHGEHATGESLAQHNHIGFDSVVIAVKRREGGRREGGEYNIK